jgi:hypothetical protein
MLHFPWPGDEYLRVLQELFEFRNDDTSDHMHAKPQDVINRERRRIPVQHSLVERYKNVSDVLPVHGILVFEPLGRKWRIEFVATCYAAHGKMLSSGTDEFGGVIALRIEDVQMPVFVDVRQLREGPKDITCPLSVVGLYRLDEIKRLFGDSRQSPAKAIVRQRGRLTNGRITDGRIEQEGKLATPLPVSGEFDSICVDLDEIERQVIESGFDLVNGFPRQNGNVEIRVCTKVECGFAVGMRDDFARLTGGVSHNAIPDCVDMHFGPDKLEGCRSDSCEHHQSLA